MARSPRPASTSETAVYVYGVVPARADAAEALRDAVGIDRRGSVELVERGGLAAVTSRVDLADFAREELEANVPDLAWLAPRVQAHEDVLERALAHDAVVPFRFGALCVGEDDARALLDDQRDRLERALARVADKVELGVKAIVSPEVLAERVRATSDEARRLEEQLSGSGGGRRYLLTRQLEQVTAREAAARRTQLAEESHAALAAAAVEARANPVQRAEAGGFDGEMLLNGAYLVWRGRAAAFAAVVDELGDRHADDGVRYELTGPWPPYNFVDDEAA
jgi:hypothetical protein